MSDVSTDAEARIRIAVKQKLGSAATITKLKQEGDVVHLHVIRVDVSVGFSYPH